MKNNVLEEFNDAIYDAITCKINDIENYYDNDLSADYIKGCIDTCKHIQEIIGDIYINTKLDNGIK